MTLQILSNAKRVKEIQKKKKFKANLEMKENTKDDNKNTNKGNST